MVDHTYDQFVESLASAEPVPGGGGASALAGALGVALGAMVGNLTLGKKKYADVQDDIQRLLAQATELRSELLELIQKDAEVFEPLAKAYRLPTTTDEERTDKEAVMEGTLQKACSVPMIIMQKSVEGIALHAEMGKIGSRIAISDVGVGVTLCKSALMGAYLNVLINTKYMKNRDTAEGLNRQAEGLYEQGCQRADQVYGDVLIALQ